MRREEKFFKALNKKNEKVLIHEIESFLPTDEVGFSMYKKLLFVKPLFNSKNNSDFIKFNNWDEIKDEFSDITPIDRSTYDFIIINSFCMEKLFNGEKLDVVDVVNISSKIPLFIKDADIEAI